MSIVFLVPYVPIPRITKRINTACKISDTSIIYWNRGTDLTENINLPKSVKQYSVYQKANEGKPLKRLGATFRFCRSALKILKKEKPDCIHVTKTDMLGLVWIYYIITKKKPKVIYEVSDLHTMALNDSKNLIKILLKNILKFSEYIGCTIVDKLVVTSESFWRVYYRKWIQRDDVIFLPNTPEEKVFLNYKRKSHGRFTIGFIGKVRYKEQLKMLIEASNICGIDVLIAGNGVDLEEISEYTKHMNNVNIYGAYNYAKDIANLYGKVDCIYSVYDTKITNVNIALPNRLYEAAICEIPIIAAKNTELGDIVESEGIGITIEDMNMQDLVNAIEILKKNNINNKGNEIYKKFYNKWKYDKFNMKLQEVYMELQ
ncbi:glycosyltransferase [Paraclostridium sordellii]|uniref:glycosyltransferase n=1 Tax=Paraclostridium sordellii TaxID=1505 RepID=UPI0005DEEC44|nr:glycosyltransferase [Paeniclostridium sordellii]CEN83637.1 glycosyltransferase [[Clostridium] sordellii] [Paeniclostridium sordellii]CEQ23241.1 glycosyltransferase [[Clostridium] sordellii] [Paeniclostridium sordellii]